MNGNPTVPPPPSLPPTAPPIAGQPGASGKAIASLILGIASLPFICCWTCSFLGIILGTTGLILGRMEEGAIARGQSSPAGRTMAKAGWITGLIGLVLNTLLFVVALLFWGFHFQDILNQIPKKTF